MLAYEFYAHHEYEEPNLIGILPERRKDLNRITEESILNWGRLVAANNRALSKLSFAKVIVDDDTGKVVKDGY